MAANTLAPNGFQAARLYNGSAPNYAIRTGVIAYNYGSKIASGDPVFLNTSGNIALFVAGGTTIHGIFRGCSYVDPNLQRKQWYPAWNIPTLATGTIVSCDIEVDPELTFQCQVNGAAVTQASVGLNIDIASGTSGVPTAAGISTCALDGGNIHATNTLPFRIVRVVGSPAINYLYNSTFDNNLVEVTLNTSDITARTGQA